MTITKPTISDYMESRRYNRKLYARLLKKLEEILENAPTNIPEIIFTISMSAKFQTPYIKVESPEGPVFLRDNAMGYIKEQVEQALDDVGFSFDKVEDKRGAFFIGFKD